VIGLLRGQLVDKRPNQVLLDVNGVGYQVSIPLSSFYALGELRENVVLLIHTHLREDSITLYGFLTSREKHFFELLISASGVGPSLALKILSGMSVDELLPAIRAGDLVRLTRIPGVGRKTAERIVVELRDKLAAMAPPEPEQVPATGRTQLESDVVSALLNLGYDRRAAEKALEDVVGNGGDARRIAPGPESGGAKKTGAEKSAAQKVGEKIAAEKAAVDPSESFEALLRAALQQLSHPAKQSPPSGAGKP
jgi:holliday junction DNA helicase RuvA